MIDLLEWLVWRIWPFATVDLLFYGVVAVAFVWLAIMAREALRE